MEISWLQVASERCWHLKVSLVTLDQNRRGRGPKKNNKEPKSTENKGVVLRVCLVRQMSHRVCKAERVLWRADPGGEDLFRNLTGGSLGTDKGNLTPMRNFYFYFLDNFGSVFQRNMCHYFVSHFSFTYLLSSVPWSGNQVLFDRRIMMIGERGREGFPQNWSHT